MSSLLAACEESELGCPRVLIQQRIEFRQLECDVGINAFVWAKGLFTQLFVRRCGRINERKSERLLYAVLFPCFHAP